MKALDHLEFTQGVRCYNGAYDSASQRVLDNREAVLKAITAEVMKPTTGMRDFLKDPDRRYTVIKAGNRKERRTKAKQQRRQRRQHR